MTDLDRFMRAPGYCRADLSALLEARIGIRLQKGTSNTNDRAIMRLEKKGLIQPAKHEEVYFYETTEKGTMLADAVYLFFESLINL